MAIKFGSDGKLYCNTVKYNYKQGFNLVISAGGTWSCSNCSWTQYNYHSGTSLQLNLYANTTAMATCAMPTPIKNHKYYGACLYSTASTFSSPDARFEWYLADTSTGKMTFGQKTTSTGGLYNYVKISSIQSLSSVTSGSWVIRNFVVNGTGRCLSTKMMIVDLTDIFGSGYEPSVTWCDENILEWGKFYTDPNTNNVNSSNYSTVYTGYANAYNYGSVSTPTVFPRDYYYRMLGTTSVAEVYLNSSSNMEMEKGTSMTYYGFMDVYYPGFSSYGQKSMDIYYPVAEPLLGQTPLVNHSLYNGGGPANYWKRVSMLNSRTSSSWTEATYYPYRFDFNNGATAAQVYVTNIGILKSYVLYSRSYGFSKERGGWTPDSAHNNYTKPFWDRRYGGQNMSIIHIPDPTKKTIQFNTNYDIVCNDIIPDPGETKVWFDTNGRIHCKTIITDQLY